MSLVVNALREEPLDFIVEHHGSLYLLRPQTRAARTWATDHLPHDAQWFGGAVCVEHRYIEPIVEGIIADGLTAGDYRGEFQWQ